MKYIWLISSCFFCMFIAACASNPKIIPSAEVKDLRSLPQDALFYLKDKESTQKNLNKENSKSLEILKKDYLAKYFSPWHQKVNPKKNEVFWILPSLQNIATGKGKTKSYGENLQEISPQEAKELIDSMNLSSYPSQNQKAIITTTTAVRAVPTNKPLFNKPSGYPFDRWQNSLIFAGTPVLITHISTDKAWVHIQSGFVYGWIESQHFATLTKEQVKEIQSYTRYVSPIVDSIPLFDSHKHFITQVRIGQIFPVYGTQLKQITGIATYVRLNNGKAKREQSFISLDKVESFPRKLDSQNIASTINAMIGQKYGWGGYLQNRDCSAFIRDIFAQYGLHLPRNSKAQVYYSKNQIDLSKLSRKDKEAFIIANATPYQSILWLQGHIMLYIGEYQGKAIVAHSAWSVTTGKKYENMLGGVVITSLYAGDEHNSVFAKSPLLIDRIQAMSNLPTLAQQIQAKK